MVSMPRVLPTSHISMSSHLSLYLKRPSTTAKEGTGPKNKHACTYFLFYAHDNNVGERSPKERPTPAYTAQKALGVVCGNLDIHASKVV